MKSKTCILIFLVNFLQNIEACQQFQTKRTCECSVTYSIGNQPDYYKKLFDLPSYDDCAFNIGCEKIDCAKNCLNNVRKILGQKEDYLTDEGKQNICRLISPVQSIFGSGIRVWASWKYDVCRSGNEPVVKDVCCNRKCSCKIVGQRVQNSNNQINSIADFNDLIQTSESAYNCAVSELDICQTNCMKEVGNYFNLNLNPIDSKILNYNVFLQNKFVSDKICQAIGSMVNKPGMDIYVEIDTISRNEKNLFNLAEFVVNLLVNVSIYLRMH